MEKVKDTIYRQDTINIIEDFPHGDVWNVESMEEMVYRIKQLPSAPERKTGKWLSHYEYCKKHKLLPSGSVAFWWCDQCEQGVEHPTNFCPNCGSYNGGEQE